MANLEPIFAKAHGMTHANGWHVLSGIIVINRTGFRWRDAVKEYGSHKTLYNLWMRWGDKGVFARMIGSLAAVHGQQKTVKIDATYLMAHRAATCVAAKKERVDG